VRWVGLKNNEKSSRPKGVFVQTQGLTRVWILVLSITNLAHREPRLMQEPPPRWSIRRGGMCTPIRYLVRFKLPVVTSLFLTAGHYPTMIHTHLESMGITLPHNCGAFREYHRDGKTLSPDLDPCRMEKHRVPPLAIRRFDREVSLDPPLSTPFPSSRASSSHLDNTIWLPHLMTEPYICLCPPLSRMPFV